MTEQQGYGQFCPIAMAAEIVCTRWTPLVLRELFCGSTRFSDLRKGIPRMSPTLLSKRLKELEAARVIRTEARPDGNVDYRLTQMGEDLRPLIMGLGQWGQRWVESRLTLRNLDPTLLMWDMHRGIDPQPLPPRRCTIQFLYPDLPDAKRSYWLVVESQTVELCYIDPGFDVDLLVTADLRSMTSVWMGLSSLAFERAARRIAIDGDPALGRAFEKTLRLSPFAAVERRVA